MQIFSENAAPTALDSRAPLSATRRELGQSLLWTGFVNGLLATLISFWLIRGLARPEGALDSLYLVLQQAGHFQFLAFVFVPPLFLLAVLFPSRRLIPLLAVILYSVFLSAVVIDYSVFKLYRFHLNGMVWNLLTGGAAQEIFVFDRANLLAAGIWIVVVVLLQLAVQWLLSKRARLRFWPRGRNVLLAVLALQLAGQALYAWADAWQRSEVLAQVRYVPFPQGITVKRFLRRRGWLPDIPEQRSLAANAHGAFHYPLEPLACKPPAHKPNILFIVIDGLRFDMLDPAVMPAWSALAARSQVFEHHISSGNATRYGIFGLFSGLYGNYWQDSLASQSGSVLIDQLQQQDYRFGFFANARLSSPEFDKTVFAAVKQFIPERTPGDSVIAREYEINRQASAFFRKEAEEPFFALVFYDAPHAFVYPQQDARFQPALDSLNYLSLDNDTDTLPFLNRYRNAVAFDDRLSGELFDVLQAQGLMDDTIIVMTGDHGQEANETRTNSWGHNSNFSRYQVQVPLVVYWPGRKPMHFDHLTSHVDVVPTLLREAFDCRNDFGDYSNGRSLFDTSPRGFVLVNNWSNEAIVDRHRIVTFPNIGPSEARAFDSYSPLLSAPADGGDAAAVIGAISRFYR